MNGWTREGSKMMGRAISGEIISGEEVFQVSLFERKQIEDRSNRNALDILFKFIKRFI